MRCPGKLILGVLLLPSLLWGQAHSPTSPPTSQPSETASEIADLWRERDAFYLRVDNRSAKDTGIAPAGSKEMRIRVGAMTRGRPWPARWTMLEVEVQAASPEPLTCAFESSPGLSVNLPAGKWVSIRLPLPDKPADVILKSASASGKLAGTVEFRRVKLVDDRWVIWPPIESTCWSIVREAGVVKVTPTSSAAKSLVFTSAEVIEVSSLRAVLRTPAGSGAVYASGWVSGNLPGATAPSSHLKITLPEDEGRLDRQTEGDRDGDGYNELIGATMIKATGRRLVLTVAPDREGSSGEGGGGGGGGWGGGRAIEIEGLPEGHPSVIWDGRVITTTERLPNGNLLIELPSNLKGRVTGGGNLGGSVEVSISSP